MLITSIIAATAAASKLLIAAKVMATAGSTLLIAGPTLDRMYQKKKS